MKKLLVLLMVVALAGVVSAGDYNVGGPWGIAGNGLNPYEFSADGELTDLLEGTGVNPDLWGTWGSDSGNGDVVVSDGECTMTSEGWEIAFSHDNALVDLPGVPVDGVHNIEIHFDVIYFSEGSEIQAKIESHPVGNSFPNPDNGLGALRTDAWDNVPAALGHHMFSTADLGGPIPVDTVAITPVFGINGGLGNPNPRTVVVVFDNLWIGKAGEWGPREDPNMAVSGIPNGGFVDPAITTEFSWTNPTITSTLTEVYLVESDTPFDPNETHPLSAKTALDNETSAYASCTDQCTSTTVALTLNNYYAWRVHTTINGDEENRSKEYIFHTINSAPIANAGYNQNEWLVNGTCDVVLDGSATDDADGYPGTIDYAWTQTVGTSVGPIANEAAPTVTFTTAGTYTFGLSASDTLLASTDEVTITIFESTDHRLIAQWAFDNNLEESENLPMPTDVNNLPALGDTDLDGTAVGEGTVAYVTGFKGDPNTALSLDGTVAVEINVDPNYLHFNDEITITARVRSHGDEALLGPQWAGIVTKGDSSWRTAVDGGGSSAECAMGLYGQADYVGVSATQIINDNEWKHIVGVYGNGQIKIYIDGVLDGAADGSFAIPQNGYHVIIGGNAEEPARMLDADIDDVRIYDRALSSAYILRLFGGSNACGQVYKPADFTQNCVVDMEDLVIMFAEWLNCTDKTGVNCLN